MIPEQQHAEMCPLGHRLRKLEAEAGDAREGCEQGLATRHDEVQGAGQEEGHAGEKRTTSAGRHRLPSGLGVVRFPVLGHGLALGP